RGVGAPVLTTVMGRGAVGEDDPQWHAVMPNKRATEDVFGAADVVLVVGCRLAARSTQGLLLNLSFRPDQTLIHLDIDPTVIGKLFPATLGVVGDARDGLSALLKTLGPGAPAAKWSSTRLADLRAARSPRWAAATGHRIQ